VLNCSFALSRGMDDVGAPSTNVSAGEISLLVVIGEDNSLYEWMVDVFRRASGTIEFMRFDQESAEKTIEFDDAALMSYVESFSSNDSSSTSASLLISARIMKVEGITHEVKWG